jgi:hypothetical protein
MIQTDDFDVLLSLKKHGWTEFVLFVNHERFDYSISHIFSHPFFDIINVITDLIDQRNETTFILYGEPGGLKIELKRIMSEKHKMTVSLYDFTQSYGSVPNYNLVTEFEIKIKQFVTVFYFQLKKNVLLLNDQEFAHNRDRDGLQNFHKLERSLLEFLKK